MRGGGNKRRRRGEEESLKGGGEPEERRRARRGEMENARGVAVGSTRCGRSGSQDKKPGFRLVGHRNYCKMALTGT